MTGCSNCGIIRSFGDKPLPCAPRRPSPGSHDTGSKGYRGLLLRTAISVRPVLTLEGVSNVRTRRSGRAAYRLCAASHHPISQTGRVRSPHAVRRSPAKNSTVTDWIAVVIIAAAVIALILAWAPRCPSDTASVSAGNVPLAGCGDPWPGAETPAGRNLEEADSGLNSRPPPTSSASPTIGRAGTARPGAARPAITAADDIKPWEDVMEAALSIINKRG